MNDRLTLFGVFTICLFLMVFGILGILSYINKLIKGGDING